MSKTLNMFDIKDVVSNISSTLEDLVLKGDLTGGSDLISFIRRFIMPVPVSGYRTVGYPFSIKCFLEKFNLKEDVDFTIQVSSLDGNSHQVTLKHTSNIKRLLGFLAAMRVVSGASLADKLYCEMLKEDSRDFVKLIDNHLQSLNSKSCTNEVSKYIFEKNTTIYKSLINFENSNNSEYLKKIIEFSKKQLNDEKLRGSSSAIVPIPIAEAFYHLLICRQDINSGDFDNKCIFKLRSNEEEWIASKKIPFGKLAPEYLMINGLPVKLARATSKKYDELMPKDAISFLKDYEKCKNGTSGRNNTNSYSYDDGVYGPHEVVLVNASAIVKIPADTVESTAMILNMINGSSEIVHSDRAYSSVQTYIKTIYNVCYPDFGIWLGINAASWFKIDESKKYVEIKDLVKDNELGDDTGIKNILFCISFAMSTLKAYSYYTGPAEKGNDITLYLNSATDNKSCNPSSCPDISKMWFEFIHNADFPSTKDDVSADQIENKLAEINSNTRCNIILSDIAMALRSWERVFNNNGDTTEIAVMPDAGLSGLHANSKYITQVISAITGEQRDIDTVMKCNASDGTTIVPNLIRESSHDTYNRDSVTEFIEMMSRKNGQIYEPKSHKHFYICLETNINFTKFDRSMCEDYEYLLKKLKLIIKKEMHKILFSTDDKTRLSRRLSYLRVKFGTNSSMLDDIDNRIKDKVAPEINIDILSDKYNRTFLVIDVGVKEALYAMILRCDTKHIDHLVHNLLTMDSRVAVLNCKTWKQELYDIIYNPKSKLKIEFKSLEDSMACFKANYDEYDSTLIQDLRQLFNAELATSKFKKIYERNSMSKIDSN